MRQDRGGIRKASDFPAKREGEVAGPKPCAPSRAAAHPEIRALREPVQLRRHPGAATRLPRGRRRLRRLRRSRLGSISTSKTARPPRRSGLSSGPQTKIACSQPYSADLRLPAAPPTPGRRLARGPRNKRTWRSAAYPTRIYPNPELPILGFGKKRVGSATESQCAYIEPAFIGEAGRPAEHQQAEQRVAEGAAATRTASAPCDAHRPAPVPDSRPIRIPSPILGTAVDGQGRQGIDPRNGSDSDEVQRRQQRRSSRAPGLAGGLNFVASERTTRSQSAFEICLGRQLEPAMPGSPEIQLDQPTKLTLEIAIREGRERESSWADDLSPCRIQ